MTATEWVELWDGRRWPGRVRDGLPEFGFGLAPTGLSTRRQLRAKGLSRGGQEPFARLTWKREQRFAWLYVDERAKPKRTPSSDQLVAVGKALAARKVCAECGPVDHFVRTTDQLCGDCHAAGVTPTAGGTSGWRTVQHWQENTATTDETTTTTQLLSERASEMSNANTPNWFARMADKVSGASRRSAEADRTALLAPFQTQLDAMRTRAETATDSSKAAYYESIWREMGEELAFIADDLDKGRIAAADMPDVYGQWYATGVAHLRLHPDAADVFQPDVPGSLHGGLSGTSVETADVYGVQPVKAHLHQLRTDALAAGNSERADRLQEVLHSIDLSIELYAWEDADNPDYYATRYGPDQTAGRREQLHNSLHEEFFQYEIDPVGVLDDLTLSNPHWLSDDEGLNEPADASTPIDLGDGALLYLPGRTSLDTEKADETDEVTNRVGDLLLAADRAEADAERMLDADYPSAAAHLREQAAESRRQAEDLARDAGLDLYDEADGDEHAADELTAEQLHWHVAPGDSQPEDIGEFLYDGVIYSKAEYTIVGADLLRRDEVEDLNTWRDAEDTLSAKADELQEPASIPADETSISHRLDDEAVTDEPTDTQPAPTVEEISAEPTTNDQSGSHVSSADEDSTDNAAARPSDEASAVDRAAEAVSQAREALDRADAALAELNERRDVQARQAAAADRDAELAQWHADDQATRDREQATALAAQPDATADPSPVGRELA